MNQLAIEANKIQITEKKITEVIHTLKKNSKAAVHDNITAEMLKYVGKRSMELSTYNTQ